MHIPWKKQNRPKYKNCGKPKCSRCFPTTGGKRRAHGPYWYAWRRLPDQKNPQMFSFGKTEPSNLHIEMLNELSLQGDLQKYSRGVILKKVFNVGTNKNDTVNLKMEKVEDNGK